MAGPVRDRSEAFQQLEAVMLRQMLKSSGAFRASDSPGAQLRTDMFVETLADAVAKAGGLGIARMLQHQIGGGADGGTEDATAALSKPGRFAPGGPAPFHKPNPLDDLDDPNSSAPLPEDPSAQSLDDFQPVRVSHIHRASSPNSVTGAADFGPDPRGEVTHHVTSGFGRRIHPLTGERRMHTGVDLRAAEGAPIRAAAEGVVREARRKGGYGNVVEIDHGDGTSTVYAHASRLVVKPGQHVERGDTLGLVGHTGHTTGPHLHFELRRHGRPVDPTSLSADLPTPAGRALNRYRERVEEPVGGTVSRAQGGKP
jgi:murein DD-endopeptidase MepM/ murein hydrolase activator NlpD